MQPTFFSCPKDNRSRFAPSVAPADPAVQVEVAELAAQAAEEIPLAKAAKVALVPMAETAATEDPAVRSSLCMMHASMISDLRSDWTSAVADLALVVTADILVAPVMVAEE
jgi:hypothetical protein